MPRARDTQRQRVYRAEQAAFSTDGSYWRQTIANQDLQPFVDRVMAMRAIQSRWGQRRITVDLTHGGARGGGGGIRLGVQARNEWVILHEVAHCLIPPDAAWHGPEFVGIYRLLVRTVLGEEVARRLAAACRDERVKATTAAMPKPTHETVSYTAQQAAKRRQEREQARRQRAAQEAMKDRRKREAMRYGVRTEMARTLRVQIAEGLYGAAGSADRKAALRTAKVMETPRKRT